jgi:hypothetical protein
MLTACGVRGGGRMSWLSALAPEIARRPIKRDSLRFMSSPSVVDPPWIGQSLTRALRIAHGIQIKRQLLRVRGCFFFERSAVQADPSQSL